MATSASVWLMTIDPPDFSQTLLFSALSISAWTPYSSKIGNGFVVQLHLRREVRQDALDELEHALVFLRVVDPDRLELVGQQIAQQLADEALLAVDDRRRARRLALLADLGPDRVERVEVADDVFLRPAGGGGADDDAAGEAVRLAELADDAAQARALLARLDLARDADVIHRRHEHEEAAGHRDVRREAGALGAERLLDDLDEDLLAFLEQVLDLGLRPALAVALLGAALLGGVLVALLELLELLERVDDVGDVEEAVALEAEVDEGGLHAGQHLRDPALVDVADDAARALAFDEDFGDEIVFENGHDRFVAVRGDDHLLGHSQTPHGREGLDGREGREGGEKSLRRRPARPACPAAPACVQFVNLRMRTLSTSPNPASVAIIDEPP